MYDRLKIAALLAVAKLARRTLTRLARHSMTSELMLLAAGVDVDRLRREDLRAAALAS